MPLFCIASRTLKSPRLRPFEVCLKILKSASCQIWCGYVDVALKWGWFVLAEGSHLPWLRLQMTLPRRIYIWFIESLLSSWNLETPDQKAEFPSQMLRGCHVPKLEILTSSKFFSSSTPTLAPSLRIRRTWNACSMRSWVQMFRWWRWRCIRLAPLGFWGYPWCRCEKHVAARRIRRRRCSMRSS